MITRPMGLIAFALAIIVQLACVDQASANSLPLKAGTYECFTITTAVSPLPPRQRDDPVVVARRGARVPGQIDVPDVNVPQMLLVPAAFGPVVLDGKGTYRLPVIGQSGKYGFNAATGRPTFTGDLGAMLKKEYNGTGTSFHLGLNGLNFDCGLLGGNAPALAKVATLGPALPSAKASDFTGHFEGSYICRQGETNLTLDTMAQDTGEMVAVFSFGGNNNSPKGSYSLTGKWSGSKFKLKSEKWIDQPNGYVMVDIDGEISKLGLSGKILSSSCSNFSALRINK